MAYNEKLADRIREALQDLPNIEEKEMMGGLTFMVNDKMCVGIIQRRGSCLHEPFLRSLISVRRTRSEAMDKKITI